MKFSLQNPLIEWRGPAPFYFVQIPKAQSDKIKAVARELTYGWGVIPVAGKIGKTAFTTALIPKDGHYLVPIKNAVRIGEAIELGAMVKMSLTLGS